MEPIETWLAEASTRCRQLGRPLVTLSYAQSLDGCITTRRGQPLALSGPQSLRLTHRLRAMHAAILVGIGTVLADNPSLTVRLVEGKNPQPVVLDSRLRFPPDARLLRERASPPWIATLDSAAPERQAVLQAAGARLLLLPPAADGRVSLPTLLECLAGLGVNSLMVEGGAAVITSFLTQRLVDQVVLTIAPCFIGGLHAVGQDCILPASAKQDTSPAVGQDCERSYASPLSNHSRQNDLPVVGQDSERSEASPLPHIPRLKDIEYQRLGEDLIVWGRL